MTWKVATALCTIALLALVVPAARHLREVPPPRPAVVHAQLAVPPGVTPGAGDEAVDAAISPDERAVVFVATREGTTELWLQRFADGVSRPLSGTVGASRPTWNRDGTTLAYFAGTQLRTRGLADDAERIVAEVESPAGATWLDDGSLVFAGSKGGVIQRLSGATTTAFTALAPGDTAHEYPFVDEVARLIFIAVRADGSRVVRLLTSPDGSPARAPFTSSSAVDLTETSGHAELHHGFLVHVRDDVLLAQRLDDSGTRLIGRSAALATGVGRSSSGRASFAASAHMALWAPALTRKTTLTWYNGSGTRLTTATEPGDYWQVRLSPDERRAAVTMLDPLLRTLDVFVVPLATPGAAHRVSLALGPDSDAVWSPDGRTLLFTSVQAGAGILVERPSQPSNAPESVVLRPAVGAAPSDWVDGGTILIDQQRVGGRRQVVAFDRQRGTQTPVYETTFGSWRGRVSSDGRWVAYVSDESGQPEVYVQPWPTAATRVRATFGGGDRVQWGRGNLLYFTRGDAVMRATLTGASPRPAVSTPERVLTTTGLRDFAVSLATGRLLVIEADAGAGSPPSQAFLVFEWAELVPPPPLAPPKL